MLVTLYLGFILSGFYIFYLESNQRDDPEQKYTPENLGDPNIVCHSVKQGLSKVHFLKYHQSWHRNLSHEKS